MRDITLGGDPTYIRGQLHVSRVFPGELPPHPNSMETVTDFDDEDPYGFREVPPVGSGDGRGGRDGGGEVPLPE